MRNQFHVRLNISNSAYKTWYSLRKSTFEPKLRNTVKIGIWKLQTGEFSKPRGRGGIKLLWVDKFPKIRDDRDPRVFNDFKA